MTTEIGAVGFDGPPPRRLWKLSDFLVEGRARGLTLKGRDWVLKPHSPVRYGATGPAKPLAIAIADAAECGMTYWADAPGPGFAWATDDRQRYHALHSTNRGGAHQTRHACASMREKLAAEYDRLAGRAWRELSNHERHDDGYRERELLRIELALKTPSWQCDVDGPTIEHAGISTAGVEQLWIEVDR